MNLIKKLKILIYVLTRFHFRLLRLSVISKMPVILSSLTLLQNQEEQIFGMRKKEELKHS